MGIDPASNLHELSGWRVYEPGTANSWSSSHTSGNHGYHMRKTLVGMAVIGVLLSGAACSDLSTGLGYGNTTGTFTLQTFNGANLPALFDQTSSSERDLVAETFTLNSDGTYADDYRMRTIDQSGTSEQTYHDFGIYGQNNTALQFRDANTGDLFTGSITGNTLTVTQFGDTYVFTK